MNQLPENSITVYHLAFSRYYLLSSIVFKYTFNCQNQSGVIAHRPQKNLSVYLDNVK